MPLLTSISLREEPTLDLKIVFYFDTNMNMMLALNASVNIYMFEEGTNFGFMNGECYILIQT